MLLFNKLELLFCYTINVIKGVLLLYEDESRHVVNILSKVLPVSSKDFRFFSE